MAVLGAVLALWIGVRLFLWQTPFPLALPPLAGQAPGTPLSARPSAAVVVAPIAPIRGPTQSAAMTIVAPAPVLAAPAPFTLFDPAALASRGKPIDESAAHQLMWLAALGPSGTQSLSYTPQVRPAAAPFEPAAVPAPRSPATGRWSFSGWLFLREGSGGAAQIGGPGAPSYGASQAGGVLRYRLAAPGDLAPTAYVRATTALARSDDRELAAGLSVRPIARIPVSVMAEARLRDRAGGVVVRPAIMAVSEFPPVQLPRGLQAEAYLQAGQVGSPDATAFADGQMRVTRDLGWIGQGAVRIGAGTWGGAQRGAARLDMGPTAHLDVPLGNASARLALDYRVRVAGDAAPESGLSLTLSTGF